VVTPHFNAWNPSRLTTLLEVNDAVSRLTENLAQNDVFLQVYPGAEHFLTPELIDEVRAGTAPTLGPGPYILVELPFDTRPLYAEDLLYQLGLLGLSPVLAHPARYAWVQSNPESIGKLVDAGVYLQATAGSLGGSYGPRVQRTAEFILRQGWYSLAGTDIHHAGQNRSLTDTYETVSSICGPDAAETLLIQNPAHIFDGEPLASLPAIVADEQPKKRFGLFG